MMITEETKNRIRDKFSIRLNGVEFVEVSFEILSHIPSKYIQRFFYMASLEFDSFEPIHLINQCKLHRRRMANLSDDQITMGIMQKTIMVDRVDIIASLMSKK